MASDPKLSNLRVSVGQIAKSSGDEHFRGRFGQVQVFDDECAHEMELPDNQHIQISDEEEARWVQHHVMGYVHDAKVYWFDR